MPEPVSSYLTRPCRRLADALSDLRLDRLAKIRRLTDALKAEIEDAIATHDLADVDALNLEPAEALLADFDKQIDAMEANAADLENRRDDARGHGERPYMPCVL